MPGDRPASRRAETIARGSPDRQRPRLPPHRPVGQYRPPARHPQSINLIVTSRCEKAGLDPAKFSAHGLRAGYLTEAANRGVPLQEAMRQSQHKSLAQAASYYNNHERRQGKAARLIT